jgi:hypothetical protein
MFININRNAVLQIKQMEIVLDREMGSCLDPKLPGTGLRNGEKGPGPPFPGKESQLEPGTDEGTMRREKEEYILDVMKEDQWPTALFFLSGE